MARKAKSPPTGKPDPTQQQAGAIQSARERMARRPRPPEFEGKLVNERMLLTSKHNDDAGNFEQVCDTFASSSEAFTTLMLDQVCNVCQKQGYSDPSRMNAALAVVHAIKPTDELETMLAVQLFASHALSMELLGRSHRTKDGAALQMFVSLATKLQRTFAVHLEALARHRRGGQQRVTVEHVHVYAGGQAVVGSVATGGASITNDGQPYGQGLEYLSGAPNPQVWSADPAGDRVPVSGDAGKAKV